MQQRYPPPRRPRPTAKEGIALGHVLNGLGTLTALVFSFICIMIVTRTPTPVLSQGRLLLYDNTRQSVEAVNTWTPVIYNKQSLLSPDTWLHSPGSSDIICTKRGTYIVQFSLRSTIASSPEANNTFACKACQVWLEAQCVLQSVVIPGSITFTSPASGFRTSSSHSFVIEANIGDTLQIQFKSHCPYMILTNMTQKRLTAFDDPLHSASLLIY